MFGLRRKKIRKGESKFKQNVNHVLFHNTILGNSISLLKDPKAKETAQILLPKRALSLDNLSFDIV